MFHFVFIWNVNFICFVSLYLLCNFLFYGGVTAVVEVNLCGEAGADRDMSIS